MSHNIQDVLNLDMHIVGSRVRKRRNELGLSQAEIYKKSNITPATLSRIENGKLVPSVISFYKLSAILDCDMEWLLTGIEFNNKQLDTPKKEEEFARCFKILPSEDQEELNAIMQLKLDRLTR